jgi:hypothetical protein
MLAEAIIGGAVAGAFLMQSAVWVGYGGTIITTLLATIDVVLLALLAGFVNDRTMSARQQL